MQPDHLIVDFVVFFPAVVGAPRMEIDLGMLCFGAEAKVCRLYLPAQLPATLDQWLRKLTIFLVVDAACGFWSTNDMCLASYMSDYPLF